MKATIVYCADGTTTNMTVEGERITTQMWRKYPRREGRRVLVTIWEGSHRVRAIHFAFAYVIDIQD